MTGPAPRVEILNGTVRADGELVGTVRRFDRWWAAYSPNGARLFGPDRYWSSRAAAADALVTAAGR